MKNNNTKFHQKIYIENLKIINCISFTKREIDIISFFVCGRSAKKCSSFFDIAPKTVENHTHNIMLKIGCNSREGIIDFIEKSDKLLILRKYYTALFAETEFEKCLKNLSKVHDKSISACIITDWRAEDTPNVLTFQLEESLNIAGIRTSIQNLSSSKSIPKVREETYAIHIIPKIFEAHNINDVDLSLLEKNKNGILFLHPNGGNPVRIIDNFENFTIHYHENIKKYYCLIFMILEQIFPDLDWENLTTNFKKEYQNIEQIESIKSEELLEKKEKRFFKKFKHLFKIKYIYLIFPFFLIVLMLSIFLFKFHIKQEPEKNKYAQSDLIIPIDSARIDRPELITQIDKRFKGWSGIQTVALVGIEGAGKTTLARYYISSQNLNNVWEINAESKETLHESFEQLANDLIKIEEDQKTLTGILSVKIARDKEDKIIQFVKEKLKEHSNWFLLYDNVESFADIQNHFPKDPNKWGQGRIIITTRDSNIENNKHVNNIIIVGDLRDEQKLDLFMKIMSNGNVVPFTNSQKKEMREFLTEIPSFPLDVSVAAYYLKATHISYNDYLKNINMCNTELSHVQKEILQESGNNYSKTRHSIITLTLRHLIETDENFKDLLLFISLLDSQNIPRELLNNYKADAVVDNFIYHLKKHSLIAYKDLAKSRLDSSISLHRSIQKSILTHLLKGFEENKYKKMVQQQAYIIENNMKEAIDKEDFAKMKLLARHSDHFLMHKEILSYKERSSLSGNLGCIYYYLCDYPRAKELLNAGITELKKDFEKNHNKIAQFKVYLGNVYRRLGEYEKAKELFEQSIKIYKKNSKLHVGIARAYGYLGVVYESLGKYGKAKELLEESLMIHEKDTKNPIGLAWSLAHLGSVYKNLEDYEKARELYEKSLKIYKDVSISYVGAGWVCENLGGVYVNLKDFEKARSYLEESLSIHNKYFSKDHIYIANALVHLGIFYREIKNYENAKNYLKKGLVIIETTYGTDHHKVGEVLYNLSLTYLRESKLDIAEDAIKKAYNIFLEDEHPNQYEALEVLGDIYIKKSENAISKRDTPKAEALKTQAISYFVKALETAKFYFSCDSPHIERLHSKIQALSNRGVANFKRL